MKPRKPRLNEAQQRWVRDWWRALQPRAEGDEPIPGELTAMGRGERAQLRRCADADELLAQAATLLLAHRLVALNGERGPLPDNSLSYERMAWVAGVLANVKDDRRDGKSLAIHLGQAADAERPPMSELRFRAMLRGTAMQELFLHWRRALQLAGGKTDVARLADDLLSWQIDQGQSAAQASNGVKFHWAYDYYLSARDRAAAKEPEFNKEMSK
ncbi:MAG: type I-E CRISPR-associated protein Cse2/CasB [Halopseudomonas yangmingensis]|uniref:CRISPR system Cascade subunit CasB n=1 Tax=Halopseudomonas yangmingensis TaxID=1720063 RepID=A0A1I4UF55_9GAMM|nr:type I-E CRISPR-associated protein Cse2/CasB [Halopseudomonas yangmingensis]SFM87430.1 CRISPR system Cascade subunit CasB [Halopseudomonas yangmingensis]